jgi:hypothetical protein
MKKLFAAALIPFAAHAGQCDNLNVLGQITKGQDVYARVLLYFDDARHQVCFASAFNPALVKGLTPDHGCVPNKSASIAIDAVMLDGHKERIYDFPTDKIMEIRQRSLFECLKASTKGLEA